MNLRPYQSQAKAAAARELEDNDSTLIVLPTGTGKTVVAASMIKDNSPRRSVFFANRKNLVWQARDQIQRFTGLDVDVEMGDYKAQQSNGLFGNSCCLVTSIQTQASGNDGGGRMTKFNPDDFTLGVADEAHHFTSPQFKKVLDWYRSNPKFKLVGITATPDRADEEALGQIFKTVAFDYEILDAIIDGWLVTIKQQMVETNIDYSQIETTAGDLNGADLARVLEAEEPLQKIAGPTLEISGNKRTLVFTASVKQAERLCEIFNRYKPGSARWVCGKTPDDERSVINSDFDAGRFQYLCNCGTHTEGYDSPGVEIIAMARPTKSRSLYAQMAGRGTRPLSMIVAMLNILRHAEERRYLIASSAKPSCLIIDFAGNSGQHKLVSTADILGGKLSERVIAAATARVRSSGRQMDMQEILIDEEAIEKKRLEEEARRLRLKARTSYQAKDIDPFDLFQITPVAPRGWDKGKKLSERQAGFLRKQGFNPDKLEYGAAKQLIGEMIERFDKKLCTTKQAKLLKKNGYDTRMTFEQASKTISALAANGWNRPRLDPVPRAEIGQPIPAGSNNPVEDDNVPF
jgi:superfamily II DNA or RNA helicase